MTPRAWLGSHKQNPMFNMLYIYHYWVNVQILAKKNLKWPPKCNPHGMTRSHNQNPFQYVIHLSLLSICANFGIKIYNWLCNWILLLTYFLTPPRANNKSVLAHPTHVKKLQTKFGRILSNSLGGDVTYKFGKRLTKRLTSDDACPLARPPGHGYFIGCFFFFFKKPVQKLENQELPSSASACKWLKIIYI